MVMSIGIKVLCWCVGVGVACMLIGAGELGKKHLHGSGKYVLGMIELISCIVTCPVICDRSWVVQILFHMFLGCLHAAWMMDAESQLVHRYVWVVAVGIAGLFVWNCGEMSLQGLVPLGIFWGLQQLGFSKFYGRADCHAFSVCALLLIGLGGAFFDLVMHMFVTFLLILYLQKIQGNLVGLGQFKKPIAMIPYIDMGFLLWVDFVSRK